MSPRRNRRHEHSEWYRLELEFWGTVRQMARRHRRRLRTSLRRQAKLRSAGRPARTFHLLDPATGHWRRL